MFLKDHRIEKNREHSIIFPKRQVKEVVVKSTANINDSFLKIFKVIFLLFRLTGIEVFSHSKTMDLKGLNANRSKCLRYRLIFVIQNVSKYTICVGMSLMILLGILMIFYKEDKTGGLTYHCAALITVIFYASVYIRRQAMFIVTDTLSQLVRKVKDGTSKVKTHLFLAYLITMQIILTIAHILRCLSENYMSSYLLIVTDSLNPTIYYCCQFLAIYLTFSSLLRYIAILVFTLYYILTCSFIRALLQHVLEQLEGDLFPEDLVNLLSVYGDIARCMGSVDEHLSQPVFLTVVFTMAGLFWGGYRIVFNSGMTNGYFLSLLISLSFCLSIQLLIMISACMTNELASKVKCVVQCLPYRSSLQDPQRKFKFNKDLNQENSLTLWKAYVMDRSLIITSIGTLLTYGILIGTLGKSI
ncbi:uncharacterized protein TNCT_101351 [Trichonephila clavata]|uniref:Uncharacterized protein n=1 Tax=Trichonephila clavata TaxID=2740835 RepID=A0A8X6G5Z6_TRICU|nr:uncharacterized protein TNCT_101351 [Trichonephila clavata]